MALSTLLVNQIGPRAGQTKVVMADDLDLSGNNILAAGTVTATTLEGPVATTLTKGLMSNTDKSKLNNIEAAADVTDAQNVAAAGAVMDSDFTGAGVADTGVMIKTSTSPTYSIATDVPRASNYSSSGTLTVNVADDGQGGTVKSWVLDGNAYLTQNETISLSSDVTGSGRTGIVVTLSASAITSKAVTTSVDPDNDRFLVARQVAGNFVLNAIAPKNMGVGSGGGTLTSVGGHVVTDYTTSGVTYVEAQPAIITDQSELDSVDISTSQTSLFAHHGIDNQLKKIKFQEVLDWANANISGGGGGSGGGTTYNVVGAIIQAFIQVSDGHLILEHTGAFTSNTVFIQSSNNHLILST